MSQNEYPDMLKPITGKMIKHKTRGLSSEFTD